MVMRKNSTRVMSMISMVVLLCIASMVVFIRFYPYTYNFTTYPKITQTQSGADGDPINMVFVGSKDQIMHSFQQAGWLLPDPITLQTSEKIAVASLAHRSYPTAPVSNLYVFGRVQDLAFEKPTNDLPTHHIAPMVDLERNAVGSDLEKTGLVTEESEGAFTPPILYARNGGGDYYESDGDVLVINYTHAPIQLTKPVGMIDELKNGFFLFYETLLTALPLALAVGMLGLSLVVVGLWPRLRWLFQKLGPRVRMDR